MGVSTQRPKLLIDRSLKSLSQIADKFVDIAERVIDGGGGHSEHAGGSFVQLEHNKVS